MNLPPPSRTQRYLDLVDTVARWSKDPHTQVGCAIVGPDNEIRSVGYNGFPRGVSDEVWLRDERTGDSALHPRYQRPAKYLWTEHAERNAIYNAARVGTPLKGCRAYLRWYPCADCARALIQVGIVELYCGRPDWVNETWGKHFAAAQQMFAEAGVAVYFVA